LAKVGDAKARRVLEAEILEPLEEGKNVTRKAILLTCGELLDDSIIDQMLSGFSTEELIDISDSLGRKFKEIGNLDQLENPLQI
jgi:hypothetical protein